MRQIWVVVISMGLSACSGELPQGREEGREVLSPPTFEELEKIDVHSHIFRDVPEFVAMMERANLRIINVCVRGTDPERLVRQERLGEELARKYPDRFAFASTFDLTRRDEPDYVDQIKAWLDQSYAAGAVMTKIWKEVGLEVKKTDGSFLMPDDPLFDPIYEHLVSRGKPLLAHLAEPKAAWLPLDPESVHYGYYSTHPEWHLYGRDDVPSWEQIIAARDRILQKHPDLVFIGAHLGSMAHDVDEVAQRLDAYPNFYVEVSARTFDLTRQPREKVREFFLKYQDRILYGMDVTIPSEEELPAGEELLAWMEEAERRYRDDFRYYAGDGSVVMAGREVQGLALPREVLEKFYAGNARRIIPDLPF